MDYRKKHEWELAMIHKAALNKEDYEKCSAIQEEVDKRIENNTINHVLMQGFRYWDKNKQKFIGDPEYFGLNGLFKNYKLPQL